MNSRDKGISNLVEHLFRHESGKITSTLTKIFGITNLELVEDVVQETLLKALQSWPFKGIPDNPSAWLYRAAKNNAIDILRREKFARDYSLELSASLKSEWSLSGSVKEYFSENEIKDSQLRMIFTCCHPDLPVESQVALALKTLCGLSIKEIANAFLTNLTVITKRLTRGKEKIREGKIKFEIPTGSELETRLNNVLSTTYLLFNEGYNSSNEDTLIRDILIEEAIRLTELLTEHTITDKPEVHALLALMFFHYARTPARLDKEGNIILLEDQDKNLFDNNLIVKGIKHLEKSSNGYKMTGYHLEAGIAYIYTTAKNMREIDWNKILKMYNLLYEIKKTPVVALNRAIVFSRVNGPMEGIVEINKIENKETLENYYLYHSAVADLYVKTNNIEKAKYHLEKAVKLTTSKAEKKLLKEKIKKYINRGINPVVSE